MYHAVRIPQQGIHFLISANETNKKADASACAFA